MSAPMSNRLPSKEVFNSLMRANLTLCLSLFIIILTSLYSGSILSLLSLINNKLTVTKVFIFYVAVYNIVLYHYILGSGIHKQIGISSKVRIFLRNGTLMICSSLFFHVIAVLFGAPFLELATETFHFGMILSTTTVLPALCVMGANTSQWIKVYVQSCPELGAESVLYFSTVCSIIGAWLGAFPIPLDWDRDWQEWPITCIVGTLLGYSTGVMIGTVHLYVNYHRIKQIKIT